MTAVASSVNVSLANVKQWLKPYVEDGRRHFTNCTLIITALFETETVSGASVARASLMFAFSFSFFF